MKRFRGGLVFKAHRLASLNSRLESYKEEEDTADVEVMDGEEDGGGGDRPMNWHVHRQRG